MRNEPAFPRPMGYNGLPHAEEHQSNASQIGMTLRDYFAAKALPEAISHERELHRANLGQFRFDAVAHAAYVMADAMLAEREKGERVPK